MDNATIIKIFNSDNSNIAYNILRHNIMTNIAYKILKFEFMIKKAIVANHVFLLLLLLATSIPSLISILS